MHKDFENFVCKRYFGIPTKYLIKKVLKCTLKSSCGDLLKNTLKNHMDVKKNKNKSMNTFQTFVYKLMFSTFVGL